MDKKLIAVFLLGLAFLLVFSAFQTMGNIQKTILESVKIEDPTFEGDGYISLAIIYAVLAICNWFAPSAISVIGPKYAMICGAVFYLFFILTFLKPLTWLLYTASVTLGMGAALIWTGQGNYLTLNSTSLTITRNSGIFWAMLQLSMFIGNLLVYFQFQGMTIIDEDTRNLVTYVLSGLAVAGIVNLIFLPKVQVDEKPETVETKFSPMGALKDAGNLFITKRMLLICVTFFYTGISLSFFSGVYSSSIGFTQQFGEEATQLVGLSGIFVGVGEVLGGSAFGIFGSKFTKWGRAPVVIFGFVVHAAAFLIALLNLPIDSPFGQTDDVGIITPLAELAIFGSFLLGLGDACFNTQIYSMLGAEYSTNSASAFAIFKFIQSAAAAICFFYSTALNLYIQLGILIVLLILGTITFVKVEWEVRKERGQKTDINASDTSLSNEKF